MLTSPYLAFAYLNRTGPNFLLPLLFVQLQNSWIVPWNPVAERAIISIPWAFCPTISLLPLIGVVNLFLRPIKGVALIVIAMSLYRCYIYIIK